MSNNITSGPKVIINDMVFLKIMHWINKSEDEVSGLGWIKQEKDGTIRVIDAILLPQKNTGVTSDIDPQDVGKAMYEMRNSEGEMRWYWHSHVNMGVFWSQTDFDTIKKLSAAGWFVSSVFNKRKEIKTCLSTVEPWPAIIDDVQTVISPREIDASIIASWDESYKKNVTDHKPKNPPPTKEYNFDKYSGDKGGKRQVRYPFLDDLEDDWPLGFPGLSFEDDTPASIAQKQGKHTKKVAGVPKSKSIHNVTDKSIDDMIAKRNALEDALTVVDTELDSICSAGLMTDKQERLFKS